MGDIETGVDKLIRLIKEKKEISVNEAAKKLGVSKVVIQEWADFLQEEKAIDIDYRLTNTILKDKVITEGDVEKKTEQISSMKDAFVRKSETMLSAIESDLAGFDNIKDVFLKLKKELGKEIDKVRDDLSELETYENLKKNIDQDILNQQAEYRNTISQIHKELLDENDRFQKTIEAINAEKQIVKKEQEDLSQLRKEEDQMHQKLGEIKNAMQTVENTIINENKKIDFTKDHIKKLEDLAGKIEQNIVSKQKNMEPLLDKSKQHEQKILKLQNDLLEKVRKKKEEIAAEADEGRKVAEKFKLFFDNKSKIETLLMNIESQKKELEAELNAIIKKAMVLSMSSKNATKIDDLKSIKKSMDEVEKKKELIRTELKQLDDEIKIAKT